MSSPTTDEPRPRAAGLQLDRVVLLGRTFDEYCRFFGASPEELHHKKIVDIASGVSSFNAEGTGIGLRITSVDPIYNLSPEEIAARANPDLDQVHRAVAGLPTYRWSFYKSPDHMRQYREKALRAFLGDYPAGRGSKYMAGALPVLPFREQEFDLALVSYFLFAYEKQFSYEFHRDSIREMMRVAGEAWIYPTVTFDGQKSAWLAALPEDAALAHLRFEEVGTDFEFLVNSNSYLRITHRA